MISNRAPSLAVFEVPVEIDEIVGGLICGSLTVGKAPFTARAHWWMIGRTLGLTAETSSPHTTLMHSQEKLPDCPKKSEAVVRLERPGPRRQQRRGRPTWGTANRSAAVTLTSSRSLLSWLGPGMCSSNTCRG